MPNLNGVNRFVRGSTSSGATGGTSTHTHVINITQYQNWDLAPDASTNTTGTLITTAASSHIPPYMNMVYIIRIK